NGNTGAEFPHPAVVSAFAFPICSNRAERFPLMSSATVRSARLNRLLAFLERDTGNLVLREAAIREACDVGHWDTARALIDAGLQGHPEQPHLLAFSGLVHLQALEYRDAEEALSAALARGLNTYEIQYDLAFAQFMQKRYSDALARLLPMVEISPAA